MDQHKATHFFQFQLKLENINAKNAHLTYPNDNKHT